MSDTELYCCRWQEERELAEKAIDPHVKAIHFELAEGYAQLSGFPQSSSWATKKPNRPNSN